LKKIIVRDNTFAALPGKLTTHAWEIPHGLSYDDWRQAGLRLDLIKDWTNFAIGDWVQFGEAKWSEQYVQAASELKIHPERLRQLRWVAYKVPPRSRNTNLTWSHHLEVAALNTEKEMVEWLSKAEQENWQTRELKAAIYEAGLRESRVKIETMVRETNNGVVALEAVIPLNGTDHAEPIIPCPVCDGATVIQCPVCEEAPATILVCPKCVESIHLALEQINKRVHKRKGKRATREDLSNGA
jgi:hypothetical protein